jgi:hypothetical protein
MDSEADVGVCNIRIGKHVTMTLSLFLWSLSHFYYDLLLPLQALCVMYYRTLNHLRYMGI